MGEHKHYWNIETFPIDGVYKAVCTTCGEETTFPSSATYLFSLYPKKEVQSEVSQFISRVESLGL